MSLLYINLNIVINIYQTYIMSNFNLCNYRIDSYTIFNVYDRYIVYKVKKKEKITIITWFSYLKATPLRWLLDIGAV